MIFHPNKMAWFCVVLFPLIFLCFLLFSPGDYVDEVPFRRALLFLLSSPCNGLFAIRLAPTVFSAGSKVAFAFCASSFALYVQNEMRSRSCSSSISPFFTSLVTFFLEEGCRQYGLHNNRAFSDKPCLFGFRNDRRLSFYSAYIKGHLPSFSNFSCGSFRNSSTAGYRSCCSHPGCHISCLVVLRTCSLLHWVLRWATHFSAAPTLILSLLSPSFKFFFPPWKLYRRIMCKEKGRQLAELGLHHSIGIGKELSTVPWTSSVFWSTSVISGSLFTKELSQAYLLLSVQNYLFMYRGDSISPYRKQPVGLVSLGCSRQV